MLINNDNSNVISIMFSVDNSAKGKIPEKEKASQQYNQSEATLLTRAFLLYYADILGLFFSF